jgi:hypothetical protein
VRRDTGGSYRIFSVAGGTIVGISGLTIANGLSYTGGGISVAPTANVFISGVTVANNQAGFGGGHLQRGDAHGQQQQSVRKHRLWNSTLWRARWSH